MGKKAKMQPIEVDDFGVIRFQMNRIVRYLLDQKGISLDDLAGMKFKKRDWTQFYQLIGYSVSAYADICFDEKAINKADRKAYKLYKKLKRKGKWRGEQES